MRYMSFILFFGATFLLSSVASSQETLIFEQIVNRPEDVIKEIESNTMVTTAYPISINKDIIFTNDSLYKIEVGGEEWLFSKRYLNVRDVNVFSICVENSNSFVLLSFYDGDIQGYALVQGQVYSIESYRGNCFMIKRNLSSLRESCFDEERPIGEIRDDIEYLSYQPTEPEEGNMRQEQLSSHDGTGDIKVLVLYTENAASSVSNIINTAYLAEELTNISLLNSNIDCKIELVYIGESSYSESTSNMDLQRFRNNDDGYMDEVHFLREKYAADICVLLSHYSNDYCGRAYAIKAQKKDAFCVVESYNCAAENLSFAHEIGHLIGCRHDIQVDGNITPYTYGHGYVYPDGGWRTIMAYYNYCTSCVRLPYWSNPNIEYNGVPMGNANFCNNSRVWNLRYSEVGNYKSISNIFEITANTVPNTLDYGFIEAATLAENDGYVTVQGGQMLTIKSGHEIVLSDGFEANNGSELDAFIMQPFTMYLAMPISSREMEISPVHMMNTIKENKSVIVYPNPTTNIIHIQNDGTEKIIGINVLDIFGNLIGTLEADKTDIDVSQLNSGIYFVDLIFENHHERYKIIKK